MACALTLSCICETTCRVTVLEKRSKFSRHNLLHVWDSSIRDLKNIGAKYFYAQLCTGGIKCVSPWLSHVCLREAYRWMLWFPAT